MSGLLPGLSGQTEQVAFVPTRAAGLRRLEQFLTRSGQSYARLRNYDFGPDQRGNVSALSPWLRHRLITEPELLVRVLATHGPTRAEKFIQEVVWRSYFKGWFEQRPSVWTAYQRELLAALEHLDKDEPLRLTYSQAISGRTGIDGFDQWIKELVTSGYLHNHARMWVASIWIFTLRLPWQLGADFFMRHLLDGDAASNTLSWRWVAGLHTKGKTYLARADNIEKYTQGRFRPRGLAPRAEPLVETTEHPFVPLVPPAPIGSEPCVLLLTEEDLSGAAILNAPHAGTAGTLGLLATHGRSPHPVGAPATLFAQEAMANTLAGIAPPATATDEWSLPLIEAANRAGVSAIATAYVPIGPARTRLDLAEPKLNAAGIRLYRGLRSYDRIAWPFAKAGFFGMKKKIPSILRDLTDTVPPSADLST